MELKVMASKQFAADFALVSAHYLLADLGELEAAKVAARGDLTAATLTFSAIAGEIKCKRGFD